MMKILLTGVETYNKGSELMLYAILQEIERRHPNAKVYIDYNSISQGLGYVHTKVHLCYWPISYMLAKYHVPGIFRHLHLNSRFAEDVYGIRNANYLFDGSGFAFSDLWDFKPDLIWKWKKLLTYQKKRGCKIVFLPQGFGPIQQENTKEVIKAISENASLIFPREEVSYNYLKDSKVVDMSKVRLFTDFTSLVKGVFPSRLEYLRDGICVIPNMRMVDKGIITMDAYKKIIKEIVVKGQSTGHRVYILNHEGIGDERFAYELKDLFEGEVDVVTRLNALEVKGLISSAYLVITSRFHGVASALNTCVPCLATSWSHKYQELFKDYGLVDSVLPINDLKETLMKIEEFLDKKKNDEIREKLAKQVPAIQEETREMWNLIWKA